MKRCLLLALTFMFCFASARQPVRSQTTSTFGDCAPLNQSNKIADDSVIAACTKLIRSGSLETSDLSEVFDRRGIAYHHVHEPSLALADYNEAIRLDENNASAFNNRGVLYTDLKKYDLAISDFTQAVDRALNDIETVPVDVTGIRAQGYQNRALVYRLKGDLVRAEADYSQANSLKFEPAWYIGQGVVLSEMDRASEAIAVYTRLLKAIGPSGPFSAYYAEALNNRCFERGIAGDLNGALTDCNASLSARPNSPDTLDSKAFVEYKLGDLRSAVSDEDAALRLNPRLAEAFYIRGLAKKRLGRGGADDIGKAVALQPAIVKEYLRYGIRGDGTVLKMR